MTTDSHRPMRLGIVIAVAMAIAFATGPELSAGGPKGYDPDAKALIQSILNTIPAEPKPPKNYVYAMMDPVRNFGSRQRVFPGHAIGHDGPDDAARRALSIRDALREGRFSLASPLESGNSLDQLPTYNQVKRKCAHLPNAWKLRQTTATASGKKKFVETPVWIRP